MTSRIFSSLFLGALSAALPAHGQVPEARYARLARGVNLTRWFQYGSHQPISATDRDLLLNAGFTSVRIAVAPQYLLQPWATAATIQKNLADLDAGIDLFLNKGMAVMLDFQADAEYLDYYLDTPSAPGQLIETWRILAARYASRSPDLLFFEIMNEPDNRFTQTVWDAEQRQALAAIRKAAPDHTVLLAPVNWSGLDALLQMKPYPDPNVIYVLHYYSPIAFTHQGATWTGSSAVAGLRNVPWPPFLPALKTVIDQQTDPLALDLLHQYRDEDWDSDRIRWDMALAAKWARRWNVKLVVNEFGGFKPFSPADSRARWIYDVRSAMEQQHLAWTMWDYAAGFDLTLLQNGIRTLDPALMAALGLQPWTAAPPVRTAFPVFSSLRTLQIGAQAADGSAEGILATGLNADGKTDLLTVPRDSAPRFFLNSGEGILEPGTFTGPAPAQKFVSAITAGRFDRSGRPGFFLADRVGQSTLLLPADVGSLIDATHKLPPEIVSERGAIAVDLDARGIDDLIVFGSRTLLLRNDGAGNFRLDPDAFAAQPGQFECGAFADSSLLAFGPADARILSITGVGTPFPVPPDNGGPAIGGCAAVADLDRDGHKDVIVAWRNDIVQIFMSNGDGTFRDETAARIGPLPASKSGLRRIVLAAANHALVITRPGEAPLIRIDRGDGVFIDPGISLPPYPSVVAPGDFNGDGLMDLAFAQSNGAPVLGRFGQSPL